MELDSISRGKLAGLARVNAETIRYYEKAGLMPSPPRSAGGHRVYSQIHVRRLAFIRRCRELGFNLEEIRDLLSLVDGGKYTCGEVLELTRAHISEIQLKIRDLQKMKKTLVELSRQCSGKEAPQCPIVDTLWQS